MYFKVKNTLKINSSRNKKNQITFQWTQTLLS